MIAHNYIKGWFVIDLFSTFPFELIVDGKGKAAKLLRLMRLPRLIRLIDIQRVKKLIKQFLNNNSSREEKIVT